MLNHGIRQSIKIMIVIVDYGSSNLHSVSNVLEELGEDYLVTSDPEEVRKSKKIILPGVGAIKPAYDRLSKSGLSKALHEAVICNEAYFLGICLGMQMLFSSSEEGNNITDCLGWIKGNVVSLEGSLPYWKVPHIGWSETTTLKDIELTYKIKNNACFYYCHSFYAEGVCIENRLMQTEFNSKSITTAVIQDNIYGVQFHPERSGKAGLQLIENFININ
ncbi:MAG: imidazole glycerol phosphate synthase subunit HisH [Thermodesulfobacteriota bacterium]|nr:MAG: imidazole glycerol phosphate synthase subunit HisH [Thermodesulfobacteriota bacterium]